MTTNNTNDTNSSTATTAKTRRRTKATQAEAPAPSTPPTPAEVAATEQTVMRKTSASADLALRPCACGCGRLTKSTWFPGDDAKAKSLIRSVARGERAMADLPGALADKGEQLAIGWRMASRADDGSLVWTAEARAPAKPAANEAPALRHLRRAAESLPEGDDRRSRIVELIASFIAQ